MGVSLPRNSYQAPFWVAKRRPQVAKMVKSCCAVGCTNRFSKDSTLKFYRFPQDAERKPRWVAAINRKDWQPGESSRVCSAHFMSGEKSNNPLSPDYVPTLFSFTASPVKKRLVRNAARFDRGQHTNKIRLENTSRLDAAQSLLTLHEEGNGSAYCEPYSGVSSCTDMSVADINNLEHTVVQLKQESEGHKKVNFELKGSLAIIQKEVDGMKKEIECLKRERDQVQQSHQVVRSSFSLDSDAKVKYYTGLPSTNMLKAVYDLVVNGIQEDDRSALSLFNQFILTLMKLRLNLGDVDLSYRFNISQSSVSRYFNYWIDRLFVKLSFLIMWPEREMLWKTMPMAFREKFRSCVVVVDCFEVFIERPSNLKARAQTWSNYKKHNTVKFLIGITPQGTISFISQGWGGRASDVHITEHCGLLEKLLPGDIILADRGFTIQESAAMFCAEVKLPPFTRGKTQLSKLEVDTARNLSQVRIHVERIIGVVRQKYSILQSTLPIKMIMCDKDAKYSTIDKIVTIACALCNVCDSVVSSN